MERKKMRFEILLEKYFNNFPKILLTNLLFAVPSLLVFTAFYFINQALFHAVNVLFSLLAILLIYPFYAGVVKVCRNIVRGDEKFSVVQTFFSGIKENFLPFLLHGFAVTAASAGSFLSINLYVGLLSQSWLFGVLLFFCILVVIALFFIAMYLPLMTVTFDLPLRYIYKNSLLMAYGEIKNNFFAFLALAVMIAIILTIVVFAGTGIVLRIILAALWALIIPATFTHIYVFFIYDDMYRMASGEGKRQYDKDHADGEDKPKAKDPVIEEEDLASIDITKLKDTDDYIFFNGKMVKQSTLLRMAREKQSTQKETKDE
ncbi:MAG: DUF624 domain-containing protein [Ruminococcus sp.]|nr:DUF624 domain-containing protein [Ruminococcus sp.]